ncbi:MAG: aldo/keto reductase [Lachnospiraceae bacterium]|jgi:diketogulonate reductase-like aldo/keto reductase|nr:aldo/keto reductase [Lachnospiraceae bacterium]
MEAVNQDIIPKITLSDGREMPCIGMGTFGSDRFSALQVADAVYGGIEVGYRMFDCAACYGNEKEIGKSLAKAFDEGKVKRDELFIMTKIWNDMHRKVRESCLKSIEELQCDYVDMLYIHWPFPNYHPPGCDVDARNPDSKPFSVEEFTDTYRQIEELVGEGLVRYIGISNMTIPKLEAVLPLLKIKPTACEIELHPAFQQEELFNYLKEHDIIVVGYMPMGSPARPDRDMMPEDIADLKMPEIVGIAEAHGIPTAEVALKWAYQRGQIPIPFSITKEHYKANLRCLTEDPLNEEEMRLIATLERGNRLVKGQVFLWEGAKDWHALWDEDGVIVS